MQNDGAYGPQMYRSDTFQNDFGNPTWYFRACTGDTMEPVSSLVAHVRGTL